MTKHRSQAAVLEQLTEPFTPPVPPKPQSWLNYAGDCRGQLGQIMGPTTLNEMYVVVAEEYDPDAQMTRPLLAVEVAKGIADGRPIPPGMAVGDKWPHRKAGRTRLGFALLPLVIKSGWTGEQ